MKWERIEFGKLYLIPSKNGLNRPRRIRGSGYKMINMGELFANDRIKDIPMELVPLNEKEKETSTLLEKDLLFARQSIVASGAGKCSIVLEVPEITTFESHLIRVRLNTSIASSLFYYYFFQTPYANMKSIVQQGVQAGIRGSELKHLKVIFPPLPIQHRIASILSSYDDLIENNLQKIKLLEEKAFTKYKIFVASEKTETRKVGDLATVRSGYAFKSRDWTEQGFPVIKIKNINNNDIILDGCSYISDETANLASNFELSEGNLLIAMTGATVGKIGMMPKTDIPFYQQRHWKC